MDNKLKLRLRSVHSTVGITVCLLVYIIVFWGTITIFKPYVQVWEKPSRHFAASENTSINYSAMVDQVLASPDFPQNNVLIDLPGTDPALTIRHRFTRAYEFDPATMRLLDSKGDQSLLAWMIYKMHYLHLLGIPGEILCGFGALASIFLTVGGG